MSTKNQAQETQENNEEKAILKMLANNIEDLIETSDNARKIVEELELTEFGRTVLSNTNIRETAWTEEEVEEARAELIEARKSFGIEEEEKP